MLYHRDDVEQREGHLAKGNRIGLELLATTAAPEGANALVPSTPSIWVATLVPMPLKGLVNLFEVQWE